MKIPGDPLYLQHFKLWHLIDIYFHDIILTYILGV